MCIYDIHICMYLYIYIYGYVYIHTYIYIYTYMYRYTYKHTYIHTYTRTCIHSYIHTYEEPACAACHERRHSCTSNTEGVLSLVYFFLKKRRSGGSEELPMAPAGAHANEFQLKFIFFFFFQKKRKGEAAAARRNLSAPPMAPAGAQTPYNRGLIERLNLTHRYSSIEV